MISEADFKSHIHQATEDVISTIFTGVLQNVVSRDLKYKDKVLKDAIEKFKIELELVLKIEQAALQVYQEIHL
jgi:hypothetical protein